MFPRLAEHYKSVVQDLVMSLEALTKSLKTAEVTATCIHMAMAKMVMEHRLLQRSERGKWCAFWFPIAALVGLNPEMGERSSS